MRREEINRWTGRLPIAMSLAALGIAGFVIITGWQRHLPDEGAAAHLFQLLIIGEVPLIGLFLLTSERKKAWPAMRIAIAQGISMAIALGAVALFRL
jgi:hypothetical protein